MTFSFAVSVVELLALNIGANGIQVDAYDSVVGGNLVDSVSDFGIGVGGTNHPLLLVSDVGIRRVEVYQPESNIIEGFLFDNLRFEAADAPEPATLALLGFGLATLGLTRRRMRTH